MMKDRMFNYLDIHALGITRKEAIIKMKGAFRIKEEAALAFYNEWRKEFIKIKRL